MPVAISILLFVFGVFCVVKPGWVGEIDRYQKSVGTTRRPEEIEFNEGQYTFIQLVGFFIAIAGFFITFQLL